MTMLDPAQLNLSELCIALEDNSPEHSWWLDPRSGELEFVAEDGETPQVHPEDRGYIYVEPIDAHEAYGDMEDFAQRAPDPRARDLLLRAIAGRGAFRRFKDTLLEFPALRDAWFRFHDVRMERRAIAWLADHQLITDETAARMIAERTDPELDSADPPADGHAVASAVARDLQELYGERLKHVILFGSWARGEAHAESDVDLLVVLDEVPSRRAELARMSDVMWRHSLQHGTVVSELPVSEAHYRDSDEPVIARARAEGITVA
jgi:hypothetical protein